MYNFRRLLYKYVFSECEIKTANEKSICDECICKINVIINHMLIVPIKDFCYTVIVRSLCLVSLEGVMSRLRLHNCICQ